MSTCHKCRKKLVEGIEDLKFKKNGADITVRNVPVLICSSCGETIIKSSVAKYVHNLVAELTKIQYTSKKFKKPIIVKEIALSS